MKRNLTSEVRKNVILHGQKKNVYKFRAFTFNINAKQLMSSIASTSMISGCSILIKTVIFLFGSVSTAGATSVAEKFKHAHHSYENIDEKKNILSLDIHSYVEP